MKISGIDPGVLRVGALKPEPQAEAPEAGKFADLLHQALRTPAAEPIGATAVQAAGAPTPLDPVAMAAAASRVDRFLDTLEEYRRKLGDPRVGPDILDGSVRKMQRGVEALNPVLIRLPENDGLREILRQTLVTASVEIAKFRRGDYPTA
jgi:hypothetical protein